jgi:hypothetical protein
MASRRTFLKAAAGITAGTVLAPRTLLAGGAATGSGVRGIDPARLFPPKQILEWHRFKASCGPTYTGSAGWKKFTDFVFEKLPAYGAVDLDHVEFSYDHYIVDDWPDRRAHRYDSGAAVEKLVTDGTPVPVVASYGMTSGFTGPNGVTARLVFYDPAHPPAEAEMAGAIVVFQTAPYPAPPYSNNVLDNYTMTDYEWRSPGTWSPLYTLVPASVSTSFHTRWVWNQLNGFAAIGLRAKAAGLVVVYDLSPAAAFGLTQRSVYTHDGKAGQGASYINCPTLTLDRMAGAKVIADAKAGKSATLTLTARFQRDAGRSTIAYLPGANYGTPRDEQVLIATHTDAMSLLEENGAFGLLSIMHYFNQMPRASRQRTLVFSFDCRHFMPGGEGSWEEYDYYQIHPEKVKPIVATIGVEHMGGRQTIETGADGNRYAYSPEKPENGGVITSLIDVHNNNIWLVEAVARAATDNKWPRVDVKSGTAQPGVNGTFQGSVKSPMNRGRGFKIPGIGLAGDWPGAWTQTYSQVDTEAGPSGFDEHYFLQQVAGLSQVASDLMRVDPRVIDLGWGEMKTAIVKLKDADFKSASQGAVDRKGLLDRYTAAFRQVEAGDRAAATASLQTLSKAVADAVAPEPRGAITARIQEQIGKLS